MNKWSDGRDLYIHDDNVNDLFSYYSNGSIRVNYEVMFNSTGTNITTATLNEELERIVSKANGTIGDSLVLGQFEKGRLFIVEGA